MEIAPEELNNSVRAEVALAGDIKAVLTQLNDLLAKVHSSHRCDTSADPLIFDSARVNATHEQSPFQFPKASPWWNALKDKVAKNKAVNAKLCADERMPLSYYRALKGVQDTLPHDAIIVSEVYAGLVSPWVRRLSLTLAAANYHQGANTMDIGRTIFDNRLPRHRLDAGTVRTTL